MTRIASPTGQWPEAIHPITGGGCMGDGQHGWAAAEWAMMIRNMFVREEGDRLILGSGVFPEWLDEGGEIFFGPTLTPWGPVTLRVNGEHAEAVLRVEAEWRTQAPLVDVRIPGYEVRSAVNCREPIHVTKISGSLPLEGRAGEGVESPLIRQLKNITPP